MIGTTELIPILIVVGLIFFFGKDKLIDWAKGLGEAKRTFKDASEHPSGVQAK